MIPYDMSVIGSHLVSFTNLSACPFPMGTHGSSGDQTNDVHLPCWRMSVLFTFVPARPLRHIETL